MLVKPYNMEDTKAVAQDSVDKKAVYDAYTLSVQRFFLKPNGFEHLKEMIRKIMEYWQECYSPNQFLTEKQSAN
jgi:hypothetical protein